MIATVIDPNPIDNHSFDWSLSDSRLLDIDVTAATFSFDPTLLETGLYRVSVQVMDNGLPPASAHASSHLIEAEPGVLLRLGEMAFRAANNGAQIDGVAWCYRGLLADSASAKILK